MLQVQSLILGFLTMFMLAALLTFGHGAPVIIDSTFGTNKYMVLPGCLPVCLPASLVVVARFCFIFACGLHRHPREQVHAWWHSSLCPLLQFSLFTFIVLDPHGNGEHVCCQRGCLFHVG
jgi:hypothetical protein